MTRTFVCDKHGRGHVYEGSEGNEECITHSAEVLSDGGFVLTYSMNMTTKAQKELFAIHQRMRLCRVIEASSDFNPDKNG